MAHLSPRPNVLFYRDSTETLKEKRQSVYKKLARIRCKIFILLLLLGYVFYFGLKINLFTKKDDGEFSG